MTMMMTMSPFIHSMDYVPFRTCACMQSIKIILTSNLHRCGDENKGQKRLGDSV